MNRLLNRKLQALLVDTEYYVKYSDAEVYRYQADAMAEDDWIRKQFRSRR